MGNELIDNKVYKILCGAEIETRGRNVSKFVVLKMLGLVEWNLDIYVKILIVRINECLYSRTIINVWATAETADQEETKHFYTILCNLMILFHIMTG
jgi:hypothetical protein